MNTTELTARSKGSGRSLARSRVPADRGDGPDAGFSGFGVIVVAHRQATAGGRFGVVG
jgi:hypothetical protein